MKVLLPITAALVSTLALSQDDAPAAQGHRLILPDSPAAKVWAGVAPETEPAELPESFQKLAGTDAWSHAATWELWAVLLTAAPLESAADAGRRHAQLALLALRHGRANDAWKHFETLGETPQYAARVMPFLIPGVPADTTILAGGTVGPLPQGVLLAPQLPPRTADPLEGRVEWREASLANIVIGESRISLRVAIESTGVQVDVTHLEGPTFACSVLLPEPEGWEIRVQYNDWMRQDEVRVPMAFQLDPEIYGEDDDKTVSLYGRFLEREPNQPGPLATRELPAQMREGGLWFELPADDAEQAVFEAAAASLAKLLAIQVGVRAPGEPGEGWTGTTIRVPEDAAKRAQVLRQLVSAVENWSLDR